MSGHSHWAGIKHKKGAADAKRGEVFGKLLAAITVAANGEPNPDFNPRLRTAVLKAKEANVPADRIAAAITRASDAMGGLEDLILEAYGPGGAALLIEAASANRNRTIPEIKKILADHGGKWAESGSVRWAFEASPDGNWRAKFPQGLGPKDAGKLAELIAALEEHSDVQKIHTSSK